MSPSTIVSGASRPADLSTGWRTLLVTPVKRCFDWIWSERRIRRDIDQLVALDDRMLADIGLSRAQIECAARFGRPPKLWDDGLRPAPEARRDADQ